MTISVRAARWTLGVAIVISAILSVGCRLQSGDSVVRRVGINVSGNYSGNGNPLISNNTGARIRSMNVIQDGDRLQGIDNNGTIFRGNIGSVTDNGASATFNMEGQTTAGAEGVMSGTFTAINDNRVRMTGTWAEPTLFSTISGTADVEQPPEPDPNDNDNNDNNNNNNNNNDND